MAGKIWSGRFRQSTDKLMEVFSTSINFDQKLFYADIKVNKAWAQALVDVNVYSQQEADLVCKTLDEIEKDFSDGKLEFSSSDEDIHSANERWLTERLGDIGARIHTGRSRNDQVVTDFRIYIREELTEIKSAVTNIQQNLVNLGEKHVETIFPGQTHLRQAQPVSLAHYLLSIFFQLERDKARCKEALKRINQMPLGSGAIAGAAFDIQRDKLAVTLGFDKILENSYDATSDRDFVTETLYICSSILLHLSRISEDFIIWSSEPFRWIEIDELYATGSSMMPQKKNPDSLELLRGKAARMIGNQVTILSLMKGVPTAYVRDLQEDKEPVFDSLEQTELCLKIFNGVIETLKIKKEKMLQSLDPALYATDMADYLVRKCVPFRKAHSIVGEIVAVAEHADIPLNKLTLSQIQKVSPLFESDVFDLFQPLASIQKRNIKGGTGPVSIKNQLDNAKTLLKA